MTRAALAMCESNDWNRGACSLKLDDLKLADNTIVLFFCDNGPNSWRWNGGMKGRKGSTDEGGVRSPLLIRWPGRIPAGTRIKTPAAAIDLLPTLSSLAGVSIEEQKAARWRRSFRDAARPVGGAAVAADLRALDGQRQRAGRSLFARWKRPALLPGGRSWTVAEHSKRAARSG